MENLDVDIEATHAWKTELDKHGDETKNDSETSSPVLPTSLNSIRYFPLSRLTSKEGSKVFLTFMLKV